MELDMLIRDALSDAKWLIAKGGTDRAEVLNRVMGKIDDVLKELDGADLIDLNKVWHQTKDVMPTSAYGGNHGGLLCVHQFKPNFYPHITHEEYCPEFEEYLKASPYDWWCRTGDLLKKEHRELYWR
jgi:hypothetical protein